MGVTDEQKVILATFIFEGDTEHWWEIKQTTLPMPIKWEHFLESFNTEYFPNHIRHKKRQSSPNLPKKASQSLIMLEDSHNLAASLPRLHLMKGRWLEDFNGVSVKRLGIPL